MSNQKNPPLKICDTIIQPGERVTLALPTPELYTCAPTYIPIHVIHGRREGPCLLVCGTTRGTGISGIAIIQRLLELALLKKIAGTLIAVPVIDIHGLMAQTRHLPYHSDLDDSFPGSETGSFFERLAFLFSEKILSIATHCIDLHTGRPHKNLLPQIHTNTQREDALMMARSFNAPVILHSESKRGMLWQMEEEKGIPTLIYEGGEAHRLDELVIRTGLKGLVRVMRDLKMLRFPAKPIKETKPLKVTSNVWIRAPGSGVCEIFAKLGSHVKLNDRLAIVSDPFGTGKKHQALAPFDGIIIARNNFPLINEGEPIIQIAKSNEETYWNEEER